MDNIELIYLDPGEAKFPVPPIPIGKKSVNDVTLTTLPSTIAAVRPGRLSNVKGSGEKSGTRPKNYDHRVGGR